MRRRRRLLKSTLGMVLALFFLGPRAPASADETVSEWKAHDFNFKSSYLSGSTFKNVYWNHGDLRGANWTNVQMENFDFKSSNFSGLKIKNSKFIGGRITDSKFKSLFVADSVFEDVTLPMNFKTDAILINVEFRNCRFQP